MIFQVRAQLGFLQAESSIWDAGFSVTNGDANILGSRFGSYHVHAMGRHTSDYLSGQQLPRLPGRVPSPVANYQRLEFKQRAAAVTGNIGEMLCWLIANRLVKLASHEVAHLQPVAQTPTSQTRCPDYLIKAGRSWADAYATLPLCPWASSRASAVAKATANAPTWWPAECKVRRGGDATARSVLRDAFQQLSAYWWHIRTTEPKSVGYGIVVSTIYGPAHASRPRVPQAATPVPVAASTVHVALFMPANPKGILATLAKAPHPGTWRAATVRVPRGWKDRYSAAVAGDCFGGRP